MARVRRSDGMEMIITVDVFLGQGQGELRWACVVGGRLPMAWPGLGVCFLFVQCAYVGAFEK